MVILRSVLLNSGARAYTDHLRLGEKKKCPVADLEFCAEKAGSLKLPSLNRCTSFSPQLVL